MYYTLSNKLVLEINLEILLNLAKIHSKRNFGQKYRFINNVNRKG